MDGTDVNIFTGRARVLQLRNEIPDGEDLPQSQPDASRTGSELRARREFLGLNLEQLAERLCIRKVFLKAIEDGRINDLPGAAYAVAFVRAYAVALDLDAEEIARRFRLEAASYMNKKPALAFPHPVPQRGIPTGSVVLVMLVLGIVGYIGWYLWSSEREPRAVDAVPPVPAQIAVHRPAPAEPVRDVAPVPNVPVPSPVVVTGVAPAALDPAVAAARAGVPPEEIGRVVIRARDEVWLQVRDRQGAVILDRILRNGESWVAPQDNALLLATGNAGGTEIVFNGQVLLPNLGPMGAVRRGIQLNPDRLREMQPAPVPANPAQ